MVGIYKITNLNTGDFYVGQSITIEKRWRNHFRKGYGARHNKRFQDASDRDGKKGFSFQVIEECAPEFLREREKFWITSLEPTYNTITDGHEVSQETRE